MADTAIYRDFFGVTERLCSKCNKAAHEGDCGLVGNFIVVRDGENLQAQVLHFDEASNQHVLFYHASRAYEVVDFKEENVAWGARRGAAFLLEETAKG